MTKRIVLTLCAAATALAVNSAQAADNAIHVRIGDLDLARSADMEVARHRVDVAIRAYCAPPSAYPFGGQSQHCRRSLAERAAVKLEERRLAAMSVLAAR